MGIYRRSGGPLPPSKVAKFGAIFELFSYWWVFIGWIDTILDYNPIVKVFRRRIGVVLLCVGVSGLNKIKSYPVSLLKGVV